LLEIDYSSLIGSAAGGGGVALLAKLYLQRAIKELDSTVATMQIIKEQLAGIAVTLDKMEKNDDIIRIHDRKIAFLESRMGSFGDSYLGNWTQ